MSSCPDCGQPTPRARRCKQCAIVARHESDNDSEPTSPKRYECTECGLHYFSDGSDPCPDCGARRRRYAGELATDGGQPDDETKPCWSCGDPVPLRELFLTFDDSESGWVCDSCREHYGKHGEWPDADSTQQQLSTDGGIEHSRECSACGAETYQFERCHECGDVPWNGGGSR